MRIESRLAELGIPLPESDGANVNSYVHVQQTGNLLYVAGHSPKHNGVYKYLGKLGAEVTLKQG